MPAVAPIPNVPYRQFTDDGDPLAGGRLFTYAAGTDTPLATYQDPQGAILHANPILLDDAAYQHIYLHAGVPYKLVQTDSAGAQQWVVDQVYGSGSGGGSGLAGVGWGKNTVAITPLAGAVQASAAVFPPDVMALGLTVWVQTGFGTSQGLQSIGLGTPTLPDAWGVLQALATDQASTAGMFLAYSGQPMPASGVVALVAYGGAFDGAGTLYVTGHFFTLTPGHAVGYSYVPGVPETGQILPPQPPATETTLGLVELATAAETVDGTSATLATHPAGVKAALDTRVPAGTALSVPRYTAAGTGLEIAPGLTTDATTALQVQGLLKVRNALAEVILEGAGATWNATSYGDMTANQGAPGLIGLRTQGTEALPLVVQSNITLLRLAARGYAGTAMTANMWRWDVRTAEAWTGTGRGTACYLYSTLIGAIGPTEMLRIDGQGNLTTWGVIAGTGMQAGLALKSGVAPSAAHPVDAVQAWVADRGAVAGKASLHVRTEDGTSHVLGDQVGIGTLAPLFPLHVPGRVAQGVPSTAPTDASLGNNEMSVWVNGSTLTFRVRDSAGVLKTSTLALT